MAGWRERLGKVAALGGLTALAAWPLVRLGYPTAGDGLNHFYRLVELDHLLRAGAWYPRWAADMAYGFGYPLFHYYSPLAYYVGALLHATGLSYANALLSVYVLALALASSGAYALAASRWGQAAGLVAAAAYGLAPYFYYNALARGALPETLGLGLLPWVLWAYARLAVRATRARWLLAALLNAALVLTHLLSAALGAPLIALVVLMTSRQSAVGSGQEEQSTKDAKRTNYQLPIASYGLSLLLCAFFLLPAVLELDAAQAGQLTTPGDLDFHNHFLSLRALWAWPRAYDARLVFNAVPPSLSLAALALAATGALWASARRAATTGWRRVALGDAAVLALALGGLVLLILPVSVGLWERLPALKLVQFPWRLVGPGSLLLALLAGAGWARVRGPRLLLLATALAGLWLFSLAWSYGPKSEAPASAGLADLHNYERTAGQLGTTSAGEFLPAAVKALPDPHALDAAYATGRPSERLAALPAGVTILSQSASTTSATAELEASAPATLTFNLFFFPGWQAAIDGRPAAITASDPQGLITVAVPAGRHRVEVKFGSTPLRTAAAVVSGLAVVGLVGVGVRLGRGAGAVDLTSPSPLPSKGRGAPFAIPQLPVANCQLLSFGLTALLLLLVRAALLDGRPTPFARSRFDGATVAGAGQALDANFEDQLVLIGADGPPSSVAADGAARLTLYWRAQTVPEADYSTTVQVLDATGERFGQSDSQHPGRVPTSRWRTDLYAQDEHTLRLLPGTPPGTYRLVAGVYRVDGPALMVLSGDRVPQGLWAEVGTLTVTRARRPAAPDAAQAVEAPLGSLTLLGYSLNTASPQAGDEVIVTLFWRPEAGPRPDAAVRLSLAGADGTLLSEAAEPPAGPAYPTSAWQTGDLVRDPRRLRVPATAPAGAATLSVSLVAASGAGQVLAGPVEVAALDVRVPARHFDVPVMQHTLNAVLAEQVTLLGYDLAPSGDLTLYWQTGALLETSYKTFVHALGADDKILAQSDSVPAEGRRPTTGWLPGEVIADTHQLGRAGAARLAVGLYDEASGQRLGRVVIEAP